MSHVEVSTEGHILIIRINRAEKYNALSPDMYHDMGKALHQLNNDDNLRVAVLYAEGKHFTAGVELDKWAPIFGSGDAFPVAEGEVDPMGLTGERHSKPLIIAVQGYCFTWGVEILLNADIRVAASDTQFQMLEVQRGLYPCGGATLRLPRDAGWGNAMKVLFTGERWSAEDALRWGMVQEVVEPGQQLEAAMAIAQRIADNAPLAVKGLMKSARTGETAPREEAVAQMFEDLVPVMKSDDAAEGVQSFVERRQAVFKGR
ncbi:MAG: crotonase/enoyl-CoA hydratase family protein [Alcanivoracaceae bacterium]|jgi:enoyl-CoA hydratase/carnithine racemase|nr:crotonase/enoyl-CoA hydratase family protein [Alcanivoracaceae bacterium]